MDKPAQQRAAESLKNWVPEFADVAIAELGQGLDNTVFVAGDLALRVGDARTLACESRLLRLVAQWVSVPVPATRFIDETNGVWAYSLLPGRSLLGRVPASGTALVLGRFLRDLHGIDPAAVIGLIPTEDADPAAWLEDLDGPADLVSLLRDTVPLPSHRVVVTHSDLGAEHILDHDGQLTGIIDWSDSAFNDPALDFARLYRDFGRIFLIEALEAYGDIDDRQAVMKRIEFFARCAALEDLAYGRNSGRSEYASAAERSITWLFPPSR